MQYGLNDILDLDHLVCLDDDPDRGQTIHSRLARDRKIYHQVISGKRSENQKQALSDKDLLLSWLDVRRSQVTQDSRTEQSSIKKQVLPGTIYLVLYRWMMLVMTISGLFSGGLFAGSFLVYHGSQPVNVTLFFSLFVGLPLMFSFFSLAFVCLRFLGCGQGGLSGPVGIVGSMGGVFQSLLANLVFDLMPGVLKKLDQNGIGRQLGNLEEKTWLVRMKTREYQGLFFWPFYLLTSIFALGFSGGAAGATFFKVLISDMAFGWQSTLITSGEAVYGLVSFIALPWSWLLPETWSFPTLEQIEGSRIILKEGISVLSTRNLVSWWPFLCLSILTYAVIPRSLFIMLGRMAQNRVIQGFNFDRPDFQQVLIRMTSPVLDIEPPVKTKKEADEPVPEPVKSGKPIKGTPVETVKEGPEAAEDRLPDQSEAQPQTRPETDRARALMLASGQVYPPTVLEAVKKEVEQIYGIRVRHQLDLRLNSPNPGEALGSMEWDGINPVILVYEAWQAPIRGLIYAIGQLRNRLPERVSLWVLLTNDAGEQEIRPLDQEENLSLWQGAVRKMNDPMIIVKGLGQ